MLISVIMITFDQDEYIDETINSILNQTHKDIELIMVPVFGDFKTLERIDRYTDSRIRIVMSNYAMITHQMNLGSFAARGKYTVYFGSDDIMLPDGIESLVNCAIEHSAIMVYPTFIFTDAKLENRNHVIQKCNFIDQSLVKRKEHLKYLPLKFSEGVNRTEKVWQHMWKNKAYKNRIVQLEKPTFLYRQHHKNIHNRGSQHHFKPVTIGNNMGLIDFQKDITKLSPPLIFDKNHYCTHITDPSIFLSNPELFKFKRVIFHWNSENIHLLDRLVGVNWVYHVAHLDDIFAMLRSKVSNCKLLRTRENLLQYLAEDEYLVGE